MPASLDRRQFAGLVTLLAFGGCARVTPSPMPESPLPKDIADLSVPLLWDRLMQHLRENYPNVGSFINPPADQQELHSVQKSLDLEFPKEFVEYLLCANGQPQESGHPPHPIAIVPAEFSSRHNQTVSTWGQLAPLPLIAERTQMYREAIGTAEPIWFEFELHGPCTVNRDSEWIVFLDPGTGDVLALDMNPPTEGVVGQVVAINHDPGAIHVLAPSLKHWLATLLHRYETGRYVIDDEGNPLDTARDG